MILAGPASVLRLALVRQSASTMVRKQRIGAF
jgi:hypothetical protein